MVVVGSVDIAFVTSVVGKVAMVFVKLVFVPGFVEVVVFGLVEVVAAGLLNY